MSKNTTANKSFTIAEQTHELPVDGTPVYVFKTGAHGAHLRVWLDTDAGIGRVVYVGKNGVDAGEPGTKENSAKVSNFVATASAELITVSDTPPVVKQAGGITFNL